MHITRGSQQQKTVICLYINKLNESYRHVHIFIAENAGYTWFGYPSPPSGWVWTLPNMCVIVLSITI